MTKTPVVLCAATLAAVITLSGQTVSSPVAGVILDGDGRLLSIPGVPGNLMPGRTIPGVTGGEAILAVAFSSTMGAVKTESGILLLDANGAFQSFREAPAGPALFGFAPNGTLQWACFPATNQLQSLTGAAPLDTSGWGDSVVAIGGASGNALSVLALKGNQLWAETVGNDTGVISSQVPISGAAPAVYFEGGWLTTTPAGLRWQPASGGGPATDISLSSAVVSLRNAGGHSVVIDGRWLLEGNWQLLEIPQAPRSRPADKPAPPSEPER